MRSARAALVLALAGAACSRAQPGPRPLPPAWVDAGGGPGPASGERFPPFEAVDHDGVGRTLDSLRGPHGLLLNFNRSVVWWPFCKSQLVELAAQVEGFRSRGIAVAAIVPESSEQLRSFALQHRLGYPLLSDPGAAIIRRLGLLDPTPSDYAVPYAGSFLIDAGGSIRAKFFDAETQYRRTAASILALQEGPADGTATVAAPHFRARPWSSNDVIVPGQRITVGVDLEVKPGHHAYATEARGYRGLDLRIHPDPMFEPGTLHAPPGRPLFFAPLAETVPVLEGRVRVGRDVAQKWRPALSRLRGASEVREVITGSLEYQVCTDRVCHPPGSLPVRWEVTIRPWTR